MHIYADFMFRSAAQGIELGGRYTDGQTVVLAQKNRVGTVGFPSYLAQQFAEVDVAAEFRRK